jgi:hypothetical protein
LIIIGPGAKATEVQATAGDDPFAEMSAAIPAASLPQSFPDTTLQKLPRSVTLSCPSATQPCTLMLTSTVALSRVLSTTALPDRSTPD